MAKFYGKIGFAKTKEVSPGIWENDIVEKRYYGDVLKNYRQTQGAEKLNDDINISNSISIVADAYANDNLYCMKYVEFNKAKWKVKDIEVQYPRLIISIGGLYNE